MRCPHCQAETDDTARFCGTCGKTLGAPSPAPSVVHATAPSIIGQLVAGRYRIDAKLGQGGMGTVYRGEQVSLKRPVALKVLDPSLTDDAGLVRRFHAEAELAARLSHPHTVTLYDFGEAGGLLYIAMELIDGKSLRSVVSHEAPLSAARTVAIAEQCASSLADAHAHGIVHRDLKPDNVMLSSRAGRADWVRVLDFGIAKVRDDRAEGVSVMQLTAAGQLLGTPQYMSPEQVLGQSIDGRTDVYALGVMMYEMLVGRPPFEAGQLMRLLTMHVQEPVPPPASKRPGLHVPAPVLDLVLRCLGKDRDQRPASMQAVLDELARLRASFGVDTPSLPSLPAGASAPDTVAAVSSPVPSPSPIAMTTPPLAMMTPQAPPTSSISSASRGRRRGPLIAVAILAAAGVAAGAVFATRGDKQATPSTTHDDGDHADDDHPRHTTPPPPVNDDPRVVVPPATPAEDKNVRWHDPAVGVYLDLPSTVTMQAGPTGQGVSLGQGMIRDTFVYLVAAHVPVLGPVQPAELDGVVAKLVAGVQGTLVRRGTRTIDGEPHISIVFDMQNGLARGEAVLYLRPTFLAVIAVATTSAAFDASSATRDELFTMRVGFDDH